MNIYGKEKLPYYELVKLLSAAEYVANLDTSLVFKSGIIPGSITPVIIVPPPTPTVPVVNEAFEAYKKT